MKNRRRLLVIVGTLVLLLGLFVLRQATKPNIYAVWKSSNPDMVLDFNPELTRQCYDGYLLINDEKTSLYFHFDNPGAILIIRDREMVENNKSTIDTILFIGAYRITSKQLVIYLSEEFQDKWGYEKIVLEKVSEYELPDN